MVKQKVTVSISPSNVHAFLFKRKFHPLYDSNTLWYQQSSFDNGGFLGTSGGSNSGKNHRLYIHDAWTEYAIIPTNFCLGAGLHYWNNACRVWRVHPHSIL